METAFLTKKVTGNKYFLLLSLFCLLYTTANADYYYTTNDVTGNFEDASSWKDNVPNAGNIDQRVTIYGEITRTGDLAPPMLEAYGTLIVNGTFDSGNWGRPPTTIHDGGKIIVYGNFVCRQLKIEKGGTLIVYGSFTAYNNVSIEGNVIVTENYNSYGRTTIESTGKVVIGGDLNAYSNWRDGFTVEGDNTDNLYLIGDDSSVNISYDYSSADLVNGGTGDTEDLVDNESGNSELIDELEEVGLYNSVNNPSNFTYSNLNGTVTDLTWNLNTDLNNVILVVSEDAISFKPTKGNQYTQGDEPETGETVIYSGSAETINYTNLVTNGITYFKIWSVSSAADGYKYSSGETINIGSSASTIFYEDFESGSSHWTLDSSKGNEWYVGSADYYRGGNAAYVTNDSGTSVEYTMEIGGGWRSYDIELICDTAITIPSDYESVELKFYWKGKGEASYDYGSVLVGEDTGSMTEINSDELCSQNFWAKKVIDLSDYIGKTIYIGFKWNFDSQDGNNPPLAVDEVSIVGSSVEATTDFEGEAISSSEVELSWELNSNNDKVILAYSSYGVIGAPVSGTDYSVGDYLSGGGEIIYVGTASEYIHTVSDVTNLDYAIWSTNSSNYSSGEFISIQIPVSLPYEEGFEDLNALSEWSFGTYNNNTWVTGSAEYNSDSKSAYISSDKGATASYDGDTESTVDLTLSVDLIKYSSATLSFWYKCNGGYTGWGRRNYYAYGKVYVDGNEQEITDEWRYEEYACGVTTWTKLTFDLSSYVGDVVDLKFEWYNALGATENNPGFCIDDVSIVGVIDDPASFEATNPNNTHNDLIWTQNSYSDTVVVAWSSDGTFGTPELGKSYSEGDEISSGGTVLYYGIDDLTYTHEPLNYGTIYYYKAWSVRRSVYSDGLTASANTPDKVTVIEEDWEDESSTSGNWDSSNTNTNYWKLYGDAKNNGGNYSAYITKNGTDAEYETYRTGTATLSCTINLANMETCNLSFDWLCGGDETRAYGQVYIDGNLLTSNNFRTKYFGESTDWQSEIIDLTNYCGSDYSSNPITLEFIWNDNSAQWNDDKLGWCIDNIEAGGIYTATSTVEAGADTEPSTISSIINDESSAVQVFDFTFKDATGSLNTPATSAIQQFVISKGTDNEIEDWSKAIAGAALFGPDVDSGGLEATVSNATITFTGTDMITIADGGEETYQLKIWLNTNLNGSGINDGDKFDFALETNDIVTGLGDDFSKNESINSGVVAIEVAATLLSFNQEPSAYATINQKLTQVPIVAGIDVNGNVDTDFTGSVSLTNSSGLSMSPTSGTATAGYATFTDLTFKEIGTVTLTASCTGFSDLTSGKIIISNYCIPSNIVNADFYINTVIFEDINNTSGSDNGYGDYLSLSTDVEKGKSFELTAGVKNGVSGETGNLYVWVDWDQSETFEDDEKTEIGSVGEDTSVQSLTEKIAVPSDAEAGTTRMRVLFTAESTAGACTDGYTAETEDYSISISNQGWLGGSTDWSDTENWSTGLVPDASTDVYIPEYPANGNLYPVISGSVEINGLEISDNAAVNVEAGSQVTINGNLTGTDDGLIIENSNASPSSLIVNGTATPEVTFKWSLTELRYWYIGLPVTGATMNDFDNSFSGTNDYLLYEWTTAWNKISKDATYSFSEPLNGYSLMIKDEGSTLVYSGVLNNDVSYSLTGLAAQWHLVANPYASYIDITNADISLGNCIKSTWTRTELGSGERGFATYNILSGIGQNGGVKYIAPGQSVWYRTYTANDAITISASARVHSNGSLKSNSLESDVLRLVLASDYTTDEAVIASREFGKENITAYDSEKKIAKGKVANFYSVKAGDKMAINILPTIDTQRIVPLGYKVSSSGMSEFTIKVSGVSNFNSNVSVYLVDNDQAITVNLRQEQEYTFTPAVVGSDTRFELLFEYESEDVTTDIDAENSADEQIKIFAVNQKAYIQFKDAIMSSNGVIEVFDIEGALVKRVEVDNANMEISLPQPNSVYIIKVKMNNLFKTQKVECL